MKNKVGLSLIIAGSALLVLSAIAYCVFLKQDKIEPLFPSVPESSFTEDVTLNITDAPAFIDDTIVAKPAEDIVVDSVSDVKPVVSEPAKSTTTKKPEIKSAYDISDKPTTTKNEIKSAYDIPVTSKPFSSSSTSSSATYTNEFSIAGSKIKVEFWNPDKDFKGYHFSMEQKKLLLFGIKQSDPLRFEKQGDKILMYYQNTPYLLEEKQDIEPLQSFSVSK